MQYDLEERTNTFSKDIRSWLRKIPKDVVSLEDCKQLTRSSGSIGANYIEANESLSKKDFHLRIRISKKEAKESCYWLTLLEQNSTQLERERIRLLSECREIMYILGAILRNSQ